MARQKRDGRQVIAEARQIAVDHGLIFSEKIYGGKTAYCVYRKIVDRVILLGSRQSPAGARSFVCRLVGFR